MRPSTQISVAVLDRRLQCESQQVIFFPYDLWKRVLKHFYSEEMFFIVSSKVPYLPRLRSSVSSVTHSAKVKGCSQSLPSFKMCHPGSEQISLLRVAKQKVLLSFQVESDKVW